MSTNFFFQYLTFPVVYAPVIGARKPIFSVWLNDVFIELGEFGGAGFPLSLLLLFFFCNAEYLSRAHASLRVPRINS